MEERAHKSPKEKLNVLLGDIKRRVSIAQKRDIENEELNRAHHLSKFIFFESTKRFTV